MFAPTPKTIRLLVSARSPADARAAIAGGCDVLDVKEPTRGSLGRSEPETIAAICRVADESTPQLESTPRMTVSVALGEIAEWQHGGAISGLPPSVTYAKLGLSGCRPDRDWVRRWRNVRDRVDDVAGRRLDWIAVIYADQAADAPAADAVIDAAASSGCRGVLVDTFQKNQRRLLDHVSTAVLCRWHASSKASGMLFAVAGSLRAADVPSLIAEVGPDVIAVRGAVCRDGVREGDVCSDAVRRLREALHKGPR